MNSDELWRDTEEGIDIIMTKLDKGLSNDRYMKIYTDIYEYCTTSRLGNNAAAHSRGPNLMGGFLYESLVAYLKKHLQGVTEAAGKHSQQSLLQFYAAEWVRYTSAARYIHHLFSYLNRHWVKRELDEGHRNIHDIYTLCLVSWRDYFFVQIHQKLTDCMLQLIEKHRLQQSVPSAESSLLKTISACYAMLGLDELDSSKKTLDIYKKYFEERFIQSTVKWYKAMSNQYLLDNGIHEYMIMAKKRLKEESERVELYLDQSTMQPLVEACKLVLIDDNKSSMQDEFPAMLKGNNRESMARMYSLLALITGGLEPSKKIFEDYVKEVGLAKVDQVDVAEGKDIEPKLYVEALLYGQRMFSDIVNSCFGADAGFIGSMDKACRDVVNRNKFSKPSAKSPELLVKYSDQLLKKSTKSEEFMLEQCLADIMVVFKYVEDKDVFQKFYSKMLAKRLVNDTSVSEDAEASMISKLKEACGFEYTSKLSRMFTDISLSRDLCARFKERLGGDYQEFGNIDFAIKVLATGSWPLQNPTTPFVLPEALDKVHTRFQQFYSEQHSGRKLTWLYHLSSGELKTNYVKATATNGKSAGGYVFTVHTYAMGVLLAFNQADTFKVQDLAAITGLNDVTLSGVIRQLVSGKVLLSSSVMDSSTSLDEDEVKPDEVNTIIDMNTVVSLNMNYKNKKIRVNLKTQVKAESKAETEETHKIIEEDRKLIIQAAIVRIMKTRKELKHVILVQEVINQVQHVFKPRIPEIKKGIDQLIDKEYIERVNGQKDVYSYLA